MRTDTAISFIRVLYTVRVIECNGAFELSSSLLLSQIRNSKTRNKKRRLVKKDLGSGQSLTASRLLNISDAGNITTRGWKEQAQQTVPERTDGLSNFQIKSYKTILSLHIYFQIIVINFQHISINMTFR